MSCACDSVTLPEEAIRHRTATGHRERPRQDQPVSVWGLPRSVGPAGLITSSVEGVLAFARLHLDGGVTPDGTRLLTGRLTLDACPWLADHSVHGAAILPGTAFAEMLLAAGRDTGTPYLDDLTLHDGRWHRGTTPARGLLRCVEEAETNVDPAFGPEPADTSPRRILGLGPRLAGLKRR